MQKAEFISITVEKNFNTELLNIETISFSNMKQEEVILKINGRDRILPPAQMVGTTLVPIPFVIQGSKSSFDITYSIKFPNPTGKLIVDYLQTKDS